MTPRTFIGWSAAAVITVVGAGAALVTGPQTRTVAIDPEPAFSTLRAAPDQAASVALTGPDYALDLAAEAGGWVVTDRGGYPADGERVRRLIAALADMRLAERKTARPDRHARLELAEPEAEEGAATRITVRDDDDRVLADALIGATAFRTAGLQDRGSYLRFPGEDQSWLVTGTADLPREARDWLDRTFLDIGRDRIAEVSVQPAGADAVAYTLAREDAEASLQLQDAPADRQVRNYELGRFASVLVNMRLDDVAPLDRLAFPETATVTEVETFDGLRVTLHQAVIDGDHWLRGSATGPGAEALNLDGWAFQVPGFVADRLAPAYDTLFEPDDGADG